jgi:hypothetical protein
MLVVLADYSDDQGNSYPGVASLARKCRMTSRNANYILNALQASGELRVLKNEGPKGTNRYRIVLAQLGGSNPLKPTSPLKDVSPLKPASLPPEADFTPKFGVPLKPTSSTPEVGFPKPLKPTSPEPSLNRHEPSDIRLTKKRKTEKPKTLADFLVDCGASGEKPIADDDPIFKYGDDVGVNQEMLMVCWNEFKNAYLGKPKTYTDWRAAFRNSVHRNWYKLWFVKAGEPAAQWTTQGEQAKRAIAALEATQ